jgi:hypothetical protein
MTHSLVLTRHSDAKPRLCDDGHAINKTKQESGACGNHPTAQHARTDAHAADFATHLPSPPPASQALHSLARRRRSYFFCLAGQARAATCYLRVFLLYLKSQEIAKLHCLKEHIPNRLAGHTTCCRCCRSRSWVMWLVLCVITRTNNKCSQWHESSAVPKSKRKDGAPQRLFGPILSRVLGLYLGWCAIVIQAPQADFFYLVAFQP